MDFLEWQLNPIISKQTASYFIVQRVIMTILGNMIDIIIVNWNSGNQILTCVNSIAKHSHGLVSNTYVVDNYSTDGSQKSIESIPIVTLIQADHNLGFGKACNIGAQETNSEYLLFFNPDAALHANTLPKVLAFMQQAENAHVGICGVQLLNEHGRISRHCTRFPTAFSFLVIAVGLDRFFPRLGHFMVEWDHDQTREVDHVIGAFFLVRRVVFEALSGFDERFFVYLEDLDFSLRARNAGWQTAYLADTQAFHAGGGTSRQIKARRLFYSLRSRLLYAFKHFTLGGKILVILATFLVEPFSRSVLALLRGSWPGLKETWLAYGMLFRWLPAWIFKNKTR